MNIKTNIKNLKNYIAYNRVLKSIEEFLSEKQILKVNLPVLSPALIPESYLEIFETDFRFLDKKEKLYLTPSPELFLKRLLAYGVGDCYYLGKSFRNSDPPAPLHSFEFTMLEFYKMGADYMDIADVVLQLLRYVNLRMGKYKNGQTLVYQNKTYKLDRWEKITVSRAFEKYAGISEGKLFDQKEFMEAAKEQGFRTENFTFEEVWSQIYSQKVEPNLGKNGRPTLIYDYPKEFASLAKLNPDGKTTQRFEFYINGIELGDCYSELTDWAEQERRFEKSDEERKSGGKTPHPIDKGFIEALKYGLGDCSGIAIGVERLAMIFADVTSIEDLKLVTVS